MKSITLVYAYYDNPGMLARQYREWSQYPKELRERVRVVLVDDASPHWPALKVERPDALPQLQIYRVKHDVAWHQDGARNLGAHVAPPGWMLLTDMDHVVRADDLRRLMEARLTPRRFYTLGRVMALDAAGFAYVAETKAHPNSYVMTRELYWRVGGYDEDYCGCYGTDGLFRKRLQDAAPHRHLDDVRLLRFRRELIPDASTTALERKGDANNARRDQLHRRKIARGREGMVTTLDFEWGRAL